MSSRIGVLLVSVVVTAGLQACRPGATEEPLPPQPESDSAHSAPDGPRSDRPDQEPGSRIPPPPPTQLLASVPLADFKSPATPMRAFLIEGSILTKGAAPLQGAQVGFSASRDLLTGDFEDLLAVDTSDEQGRYELRLEFPLEGWITVERSGYVPIEERFLLLRPGFVRRNYSLLETAASLSGRVVDGADGNPLGGARVEVSFSDTGSLSRLSTQTTASDAEGEFTIQGLPAGPLTVSASRGSYVGAPESLSVAAGSYQVELLLNKADAVSFAIKNEKGIPLGEAWVFGPPNRVTRADEDGLVVLPTDPEGGAESLRAWAPGYLTHPFTLHPKSPPASIVLTREETLSGTLLSERGEAVGGAEIVAYSKGSQGWGYEKTVESDAEGRFLLTISRPPVQRIRVTKPGYIETWVVPGKVTPKEGLEVRLKEAEAALFGRVVSDEGKPVRRFGVFLSSGEGSPEARYFARFFDDPEGQFALLDLAAGPYRLRVESLGSGKRTLWEEVEEVGLQSGLATQILLHLEGDRELPEISSSSPPSRPQ